MASRNFSASAHFFCRFNTPFADDFVISPHKSQCRWGVVSSTWITGGNDILSPYFSPRASFLQRLIYPSLCEASPKLSFSASNILIVFPNRFIPCIQPPNGHPPAFAIRLSSSVSERYHSSFGQACHFCLNVYTWSVFVVPL